jgi:hypothetical protein
LNLKPRQIKKYFHSLRDISFFFFFFPRNTSAPEFFHRIDSLSAEDVVTIFACRSFKGGNQEISEQHPRKVYAGKRKVFPHCTNLKLREEEMTKKELEERSFLAGKDLIFLPPRLRAKL